jgi:hypothetical protein
MAAPAVPTLGLMANTFWAAGSTLPPIFWVLMTLILTIIFGLLLFTFWATARAARKPPEDRPGSRI